MERQPRFHMNFGNEPRRRLSECINEILVQKARSPQSWLGPFLEFKKGDPLAISCYRPVCLLDTAYKILSALITDRLTRMCERHGLQDPSQEGFRRLRSTQRQVQSLHWVIEDVAEKKGKLYLTDIVPSTLTRHSTAQKFDQICHLIMQCFVNR